MDGALENGPFRRHQKPGPVQPTPAQAPSRARRSGALISGLPTMAVFVPDRARFLDLARQGRLCFVYREWLADADTPVSVFAKLGRGPYSFLLESVVGGEKWAAYSFAGVRPRAVIRARGTQVERLRPDGDGFVLEESVSEANPLDYVSRILADLPPAVPPGLPRFFGGAVGWLGYDAVRRFERLPEHAPDELGLARDVLCPDRHRGGFRQPARHHQGGGFGGRRGR